MRITIVLALTLLVAACGGTPVGGDATGTDGALSARISGASLRLESHADASLYYLAYREGVLAQFARCLAPDCPAVPPGDVVLVPLDSLTGWDANADAVHVEYWKLIHDAGGYRADSIHTLVVGR